jgi:hypothetical protein
MKVLDACICGPLLEWAYDPEHDHWFRNCFRCFPFFLTAEEAKAPPTESVKSFADEMESMEPCELSVWELNKWIVDKEREHDEYISHQQMAARP